jgi:hypothetical protein
MLASRDIDFVTLDSLHPQKSAIALLLAKQSYLSTAQKLAIPERISLSSALNRLSSQTGLGIHTPLKSLSCSIFTSTLSQVTLVADCVPQGSVVRVVIEIADCNLPRVCKRF